MSSTRRTRSAPDDHLGHGGGRAPSRRGRPFLWKIIIDERYQGHGYGAEVVRKVAEIVRAAGATELFTSYVPEDGGPAGFYQRLGFVSTGEVDNNGEPIVRLALA